MTLDHVPDQDMVDFAALLRGRRLAAGLTQAELASLAGVGVRTVRDLERGKSSRPHRTTVQLLAAALGLSGGEWEFFTTVARGAGRPAGAVGMTRDVVGSAGRPTSGVPLVPDDAPVRVIPLADPGRLVGRQQQLAQLSELLRQRGPAGRLVTLAGIAGVGKTQLGLAAAYRASGRVVGVVVTERATRRELLAAVAAGFGVRRVAELGRRLATEPALVLVDAVDRAPAAVRAALRQLWAIVPGLRVLAIGRQALGLPGERVWPVPPLEVPPAGVETKPEVVARYPAAALFLARLREVRSEPLAPHEVAAVVGLVRRLGGVPLAIEFAAARGRVLRVDEILLRYGDRPLDLADPSTGLPMWGTLRDAVAASYRLLTPVERAALRRLAVLRHWWSVELAEELLHAEPRRIGGDPIPLLDRLITFGLVEVRGSGGARFRLLDLVRDFALERAAARGELPVLRRQHARVFAAFAERVGPQVSAASTVAVTRLDEVSADLWAALVHAANDDPPTALRLAVGLVRWWSVRGYDVPGRRWLHRLLADPRTGSADPAVRAWARLGVARFAVAHGAGREELPAARAALREFERLGEVGGQAAARHLLAAVARAMGEEPAVGGDDGAAQRGRCGQ